MWLAARRIEELEIPQPCGHAERRQRQPVGEVVRCRQQPELGQPLRGGTVGHQANVVAVEDTGHELQARGFYYYDVQELAEAHRGPRRSVTDLRALGGRGGA